MIKSRTFSSLFIGNGSVSRPVTSYISAAQTFQFPLHREWFCIHSGNGVHLVYRLPFSSLFIGNGSVSTLEALLPFLKLNFQFPLHREWFCIADACDHAGMVNILSVPSS